MVKKEKKRVFVGMSGGVDSSVSAALLKKGGYDVVGVFIKVWEPEGFACTWREDRRDAMRVAAVLDIPLVTIDLSKEYEREVVRYMISGYRAGRTPNPDIACNQEIKFGAFYRWAQENGADYVATGHYARIKNGKLLQSKDKNKDQTYFLWTFKPEQIKNCLFPIGNYQKSEVRKLAKKFRLPNFSKRDSQGLCFIGRLEIKKFLQRYIKTKKGKVLDEGGEIMGEHDGVWFYTIGERKHGYVVRKDVKKNILFVSNKPPQLSVGQSVKLGDSNWLIKPEKDKAYWARIRHRGELYSCHLMKEGGGWFVKFRKSPLGLAPGQSLVLYDRDLCVGGGVIV